MKSTLALGVFQINACCVFLNVMSLNFFFFLSYWLNSFIHFVIATEKCYSSNYDRVTCHISVRPALAFQPSGISLKVKINTLYEF